MSTYKVGIDLGGTKIESILLNENGDEVFRKRIPTPKNEGYDAIVNAVCGLIEETRNLSPGGATLGIGIPGILDRTTDLVINANTTSLIGHPLRADIEKIIQQEAVIENDANCFTLAECAAGAAKGYGLVFGIIMGTGCGGGLFVNGRVRSGPHGIAGEWGHVAIDPSGLDCFCGKKGCIETKISGSGVERTFEKKYGKKIPMNEIVNQARKDHPECLDIFSHFLDNFGLALGGLISILDPDAVVLGGGLSNIQELYTIGIEKMRKYAFHPGVRTPVLKNVLGDSAGVIGAAWLGENSVWKPK